MDKRIDSPNDTKSTEDRFYESMKKVPDKKHFQTDRKSRLNRENNGSQAIDQQDLFETRSL